MVAGDGGSFRHIVGDNPSVQWAMFAGSGFVGRTAATDDNYEYAIAKFDGASSILNVNGTTQTSLNPGNHSDRQLSMAGTPSGGNTICRIREVLLYPGSQDLAEIETYFNTKYGAGWPKPW